jgi:hypothetical protein
MKTTGALVLLVALVLPAILAVAPRVEAQLSPAPSAERYFRLEWQAGPGRRGGAAIRGYLYNDGALHAGDIQLVVETVDAGGQVTGRTVRFLPGTAPPFSRTYFDITVPGQGATYRVGVLSWSWIGRGA